MEGRSANTDHYSGQQYYLRYTPSESYFSSIRDSLASTRLGEERERERERYLCTINISVWYFCAAMVMQYLYALHSVLMFAFVMIPIVYEWSEDR